MTWPIATGLDRYLADQGDPVFNSWVIWRINENILTNPFDILHGNIFFPYDKVIAFSENMISGALLVLPIHILSGHPIIEYNSLLILAFALNGFGVFLLARKITGNRTAALLGGLIFAFSMPRYNHIQHLQMLLSFWIPIAFLLWIRFLEKPTYNRGALFVSGSVLVMLSNMHFALYFTYSIALWFLYEVAICGLGRAKVLFKKLIVPLVPALALLMPVFLPYMGNDPRERWDIASYTASFASYINPNPGNWLYGHFGRAGAMWFPGIVAILFAMAGLIYFAKGKQIKDRTLPIFLVLGLLAFWASLGTGYGLYEFLYSYAPGFDGIRAVERIAILYLLSLSIFAAVGLAVLLEHLARRNVLAGVIVCSLLLIESISIPKSMFKATSDEYTTMGWLAQRDDVKNILLLPIADQESWLTLSTVYHRKNMMNGYSGYFPPLYRALAKTQWFFPTKEQVEILQAIGVDHVVLNAKPAIVGNVETRLSFTHLKREINRFDSLSLIYERPGYALIKLEPKKIQFDREKLLSGDMTQFFDYDVKNLSIEIKNEPILTGPVFHMTLEVLNGGDQNIPPDSFTMRVTGGWKPDKPIFEHSLNIIVANTFETVEASALAPEVTAQSIREPIVIELIDRDKKVVAKTMTRMEQDLPKFALIRNVFSSVANEDVNRVIDTNVLTGWTTGTSDVEGAWLVIDLGEPVAIANLSLVNWEFIDNHPTALDLSLSNDGKTWKPLKRYENLKPTRLGMIELLSLEFPQVETRFIKIVPRAIGENNWWFVYEAFAYL